MAIPLVPNVEHLDQTWAASADMLAFENWAHRAVGDESSNGYTSEKNPARLSSLAAR